MSKKGWRKYLAVVLSLVMFMPIAHAVDCIIFSYNRPMQLYALLETMESYLTGVDDITVICRADTLFLNAYQHVQTRFPAIKLVMQAHVPYDFKPLLLDTFHSGKSPYIMFGVDDIVITDAADLNICTTMMERVNAYAFYLRLGLNINAVFPTGKKFDLPVLKEIDPWVVSWPIMENRSIPYWGYPNTVDMAIYRKKDIERDLESMQYRNPNILEGTWCGRISAVQGKVGLAFKRSIIVNIPVNQVQTEWQNPLHRRWSVEQLLDLFEQGMKIDTKKFFKFENPSCHFDSDLSFVSRDY